MFGALLQVVVKYTLDPLLFIWLNNVALFIYAKDEPIFILPLHIAISCWKGAGVAWDWVLYIVKDKYDAWQVDVLDVGFDILKAIGGWK